MNSGGIGRDAEDALGILRGQRGYRSCRIGVEHRHGLDVGLDAGAAAGIGTGDDQHPAAHYSAAWAGLSREGRARSSSVPAPRREDRLADLVDHRRDQLLVLAFGHDPDHRLGSRFADHQAAGDAEPGLAVGDGPLDCGRFEGLTVAESHAAHAAAAPG